METIMTIMEDITRKMTIMRMIDMDHRHEHKLIEGEVREMTSVIAIGTDIAPVVKGKW